MEDQTRQKTVQAIESDQGNRVTDVDMWKVGPAPRAAMVSAVTSAPCQEYVVSANDGS